MIPVVTRDYKQWKYYMNKMEIPQRVAQIYYPYISDHRKLMGIERWTPIMLLGNYYHREDWPELNAHISYRQLKIVEFKQEVP